MAISSQSHEHQLAMTRPVGEAGRLAPGCLLYKPGASMCASVHPLHGCQHRAQAGVPPGQQKSCLCFARTHSGEAWCWLHRVHLLRISLLKDCEQLQQCCRCGTICKLCAVLGFDTAHQTRHHVELCIEKWEPVQQQQGSVVAASIEQSREIMQQAQGLFTV